MAESRNAHLLGALQSQLDRNEQVAASLFSVVDRLFGLALIVFGGALTLGLKEDRREVFLVLPAAIITTIVLGFTGLIQVAAREGYSRYLETCIRKECGISDLVWASKIGPTVVSHALTCRFVLTGTYVFFLAASCYLSIDAAFSVQRLRVWRFPAIGLALVASAAFILAAVEATRAHDRSHDLALTEAERK